ncbi:uncharacterized protein LOC134765771 [Penaeus indicus]|uniref:uncharacterized protein LOC134765771 n=1 Tax=Penaeus indicus TaxID=29960 RepID=UPI00300D1944
MPDPSTEPQQEPLLSDDIPSRPFESVSADFFTVAGKAFLVIADRLSGWPTIIPCGTDTSTSRTVRMFCRYFREVGVPVRLRTDGGPQFSSLEFQSFMKCWAVHHVISTPHYPQSNGHAEAAVKSAKYLILKTAPSGNIDTEEFDRGLLELRNTPTAAGRSPAQVLYGHPLRTCVPAHPASFAQEWQECTEDYDRRAAARAGHVKSQYDKHAQSTSQVECRRSCRIQNTDTHRWDKVGVIMGCGRNRDYEVRLPSGRVWWRNRRFLRPIPDPSVDPLSHIPVVPCTDKTSTEWSRKLERRRSNCRPLLLSRALRSDPPVDDASNFVQCSAVTDLTINYSQCSVKWQLPGYPYTPTPFMTTSDILPLRWSARY